MSQQKKGQVSCTVWEASLYPGWSPKEPLIRPDTLHTDTQGQSETVFGLAYLLGIKLMPRIQNWKISGTATKAMK